MINRFFSWFRSIPRWLAWVLGLAVFAFVIGFAVVASATAWEYTNSPEFCGTTCHTMPPEYTAYQVSPHARVACVDCHLGQDSFRQAVPAKAKEITHVTNALFNTYDPPIYVKNLKPARDTCEKCHNPDKFSFDTFEQFSRFLTDETNSEERYYMTFKTGGGKEEQGLGKGIHWHIDSEVYFYTDDPLKQTIPYVKSVAKDGTVTEYFDSEAGLPPDFGEVNAAELKRMDCIDCHNRISHNFRSPNDSMDVALNTGQIDKDMPYIKAKGAGLLSAPYATVEEAHDAVDRLDEFYSQNYPAYYAANQDKVAEAIDQIKTMFDETVFPDMSVGWQTHPNNVGHKDFPGCFRCHDGKHTTETGETIRLECNVCHSIPEIVKPGQQPPVINLDTSNEPESHKNSNWLAQHRYVFDESCAECHDVSNPGGTDNSSFCSNAACHATEWKFVGLNAPSISNLVAPPKVPGSGTPEVIPHPIGPNTDCKICHGPEGVHPFPDGHESFDVTMCTQCHQVTGTIEPSAGVAEPGDAVEPTPKSVEAGVTETPAPAGGPPAIPHSLDGRDNCLACHATGGIKPYPADHEGRTVDQCQMCHQPASDAAPAATEAPASATPVATAVQEATPEPTATTAAQESTGIPGVPHPLEGRDDCVLCHGENGVKPFPADHTGRTSDMCLQCHLPVASGDTSSGDTSSGDDGAAAASAPEIPHDITGQENQCLTCHYTGSVKPFPSNHEGYSNEMCLSCHQPGS